MRPKAENSTRKQPYPMTYCFRRKNVEKGPGPIESRKFSVLSSQFTQQTSLTEEHSPLYLMNIIQHKNLQELFSKFSIHLHSEVPKSEFAFAAAIISSPLHSFSFPIYSIFMRLMLLNLSSHTGTVFRERTRQPTYQHHEQEVLAEKFLRAIEEEREREQEQEYKNELKNLWNVYQHDENDIERELFANEFDDDNSLPIEEMKRKRQVRRKFTNIPFHPHKKLFLHSQTTTAIKFLSSLPSLFSHE